MKTKTTRNDAARHAHYDTAEAAANPFYLYSYGANAMYDMTVEDQLMRVKTFTLAQCLPSLPSTVRRAVAARLKRLHKQAKAAR